MAIAAIKRVNVNCSNLKVVRFTVKIYYAPEDSFLIVNCQYVVKIKIGL